jgi:hypothetical protein
MIFSKNLHITPPMMDAMEFYRIENILEAYEEFIEEENKQHKEQQTAYEKQQKSQENSYKQPKMDYGSFKMRSMPAMQAPKF